MGTSTCRNSPERWFWWDKAAVSGRTCTRRQRPIFAGYLETGPCFRDRKSMQPPLHACSRETPFGTESPSSTHAMAAAWISCPESKGRFPDSQRKWDAGVSYKSFPKLLLCPTRTIFPANCDTLKFPSRRSITDTRRAGMDGWKRIKAESGSVPDRKTLLSPNITNDLVPGRRCRFEYKSAMATGNDKPL